MSRIRASEIEGLEGFGTVDACFFCGGEMAIGAWWNGYTDEPLNLCRLCAWNGQLGSLIGDAARDCRDVTRMIDATAREAWRALALAQERTRTR
jgi:hypothetical protein